MFAPGGSTPLNAITFTGDGIQLADDGVAVTPDDSLLFAITATIGSQLNPQLNIVPNPAQPAPPAQDPTSTAMTCSPNPDAIGQATASGSALESVMATMGMPRRVPSATAMDSRWLSTMTMASG